MNVVTASGRRQWVNPGTCSGRAPSTKRTCGQRPPAVGPTGAAPGCHRLTRRENAASHLAKVYPTRTRSASIAPSCDTRSAIATAGAGRLSWRAGSPSTSGWPIPGRRLASVRFSCRSRRSAGPSNGTSSSMSSSHWSISTRVLRDAGTSSGSDRRTVAEPDSAGASHSVALGVCSLTHPSSYAASTPASQCSAGSAESFGRSASWVSAVRALAGCRSGATCGSGSLAGMSLATGASAVKSPPASKRSSTPASQCSSPLNS